MITDGIRREIERSQDGNITSPAESALHDICLRLCDEIDGLEARLVEIEDKL